jgi:two-component system, chemotaxis family, chemotaxis protein CheY
MQVTAMNNETIDASLKLPEILDLAAAEGLLEALRQQVHGDRSLCIDASDVETLTLPCMQIILAAKTYHGGVSIKNPSAAFTSAIEDLGIHLACITTDNERQFQETVEEQDQGPQKSKNQDEGVPPLAANGDGPQVGSDRMDLQQISENVMSKRILTIDDSKTMRDMLMLTLAEAGFDVLQAVDGQDGLDVLVNERVDVVITDINMPRMDGYEVIRQLRKNPDHKTTPILVLTTESELEKRNLARQAGATGWMVKPFDPDRLIETVRKVAP